MNFSVKEKEKDAMTNITVKKKERGVLFSFLSLTCPALADSTAQEYIL